MRLNLYLRFGLFVLLSSMLTFSVSAQQNFFKPALQLRGDISARKIPQNFLAYKLDEAGIRSYLSKAPSELNNNVKALLLQIPLPNGLTEVFNVSESSILSPEIAARHPEMKTYQGIGQIHSEYSIRISFTSTGFNAIILGIEGGEAYIEMDKENTEKGVYNVYFGKDVPRPEKSKTSSNRCGSMSNDDNTSASRTGNLNSASLRETSATATTGGSFRVFKLAMAATAEFTAKKGGTKASAFNALFQYVNQVIAVYRRELSVSFTLVSDTNLVFTTPGVPYTNNNQSKMLSENQRVVDSIIGNTNYNVGHVIGYSGGSGEGLALIPAVCVADSKAKGVSGIGDGSFAAIFDDQTISHEIGHMFGMSHTFNSSIPVCTTREATTSVEPGSGTTIMSYGYTCSDASGNDDYENTYQPILNFHTVSYTQAVEYINTLNCYTTSVTTNVPPIITEVPSTKTIPKSTPFELTGTATDANVSDALTYSWEGTNIGEETPTPAILTDNTKPPFFRSYAPSSSATRLYPRLSAILDGTNNARGDKLPSIGITTTHRLTVRDNSNGVTNSDVTVIIDGNSGPFLETTNLAGTYTSGSTQTITWAVANTTAAPVSCSNVNILLSTDGGLTFPTTLVANTPNDGTEPVVLPTLSTGTTRARIKVMAANNIFFDISNNDFTISAGVLSVDLVNLQAAKQAGNVLVSWKTVTETELLRYEVEHSIDGISYTKLGEEVARNAAGPNNYSFLDTKPANGMNYYRLQIVSRSGKKYSQVLSVANNANGKTGITAFPNPVVNGYLAIQFNNMPAGSFTVNLYNLAGQVVMEKNVSHPGTNSAFQFQLTGSAIVKGVYQMVITGANKEQYKQNIIVQ